MGTVSLDFEGLKATLWKNRVNFVKDVHMIYVNFIIIVVTVPEEKKNRRHYFVTAPCITAISYVL